MKNNGICNPKLVKIALSFDIKPAGFISKDKAILTNFGLQIPLFFIGFYKVIFG